MSEDVQRSLTLSQFGEILSTVAGLTKRVIPCFLVTLNSGSSQDILQTNKQTNKQTAYMKTYSNRLGGGDYSIFLLNTRSR